jgi:Ran GTPase-activating protein (RanGAP) involved in mRNA processing and transport
MYVSKNAEAKRWLQTDASGNDVDNQVNRKLAALIATFEEFRVVRPSDLVTRILHIHHHKLNHVFC